MRRLLQDLGEGMTALGQLLQGLRAGAEILGLVGQVDALADHPDGHAGLQEALADAGVDHRRFPARVAADEQHGIGTLDAGDACIEEIAGPRALPDLGAVLTAVEVG